MKVHFIVGRLGGGGAERVVSLLANHLDERGLDISVITFRDSDDYPLRPSVSRLKFHKQRLIKKVLFNGFFSLLWYYRKKRNRPDIISSHVGKLGFITIPIARLYGIKIITSEHINHITNFTSGKTLLHKYWFPHADIVTVLTKFDMEYYAKKGCNVRVMYNPITFTASDKPVDDNEYKTIVAVGDLNRHHHKGFDNLINIAKELLKIHPDWRFKIVGGGDAGMKHLSALADEYNVSDKVIFTGFQSNVKAILDTSDIFVLPSRFEGLPMSLLEAMSRKLACIAYDCVSGPSEIITHNVNGLLIQDQDQEAMVQGLSRLITDKDFRQKLRRGTQDALHNFEMDTVGDQWVKLFDSLTPSN